MTDWSPVDKIDLTRRMHPLPYLPYPIGSFATTALAERVKVLSTAATAEPWEILHTASLVQEVCLHDVVVYGTVADSDHFALGPGGSEHTSDAFRPTEH